MENLTVAPGGLIRVLDKLLIHWDFHALTISLFSLRMVPEREAIQCVKEENAMMKLEVQSRMEL